MHRISLISLSLLVLATAGRPARAQGQPIDLSTWQVVQYELNFQPDASWNVQPGNDAVLQTVNSDASIYIGDFDSANRVIRGTWSVQSTSDDDFMGFVFGYQSREQYYLFDWKQASQLSGGLAEVGMSLKVVDLPAGQDPTQADLWPTTGSANVTTLAHNTVPWQPFTDYDFELEFTPGTIRIVVREAGVELENWTISDSTYTDGSFGFYNYSQDEVLYQGFTQEGVSSFYCTAKVNSQGCLPVLSTTGFASLSDGAAFDVVASELISNRNGALFLSLAGPAATPFQGGTLCLQPPLLVATVDRTFGNPPPEDCSGTLALDFNAYAQGAGVVPAGAAVHAQYFYRDPAHPDGTGYGLTSAVTFDVLP